MAAILTKEDICNLIPHTGSMCLLDKVTDWDNKSITCIASSHRDISNPLRNNSGLPMTALIEYGAQAMAVHGCLVAAEQGVVMAEGYLAALRDAEFTQGLLSVVGTSIEIYAERLFIDKGNMIYHMRATSSGKPLASARATVFATFENKEDKS